MIDTLARTCYRHRRAVVGAWVALLIAMSMMSSSLGGELRTDFSLPGSEAEEARQLLERGGFAGRAGHSGQIVFAAGAGSNVDDPAVRGPMEALLARVEAEVPGVYVVSPYQPAGSSQVAPGARVAFAEVSFGDVDRDQALALARSIADLGRSADLPDGLQVELGGELFYEEAEFSSEAFGLLAAVVILLVAFGSVLAMGLPVITALFGIGCGMAIVALGANVLDVPEFAPPAVAMIAIGVGIDYALVIVTRFREELASGSDPEVAVVRSLGTAGRAVLFAGMTVVVSLAGLLLVGLASIRSLAVAASAGVLMVMLASLTLLPALLGFCGHAIDRLSIHRLNPVSGRRSTWFRWSRLVQRRPGPMAVAGFAALLLLAAPVLGMRLGFGDAGNRPTSDTARRAYDLVAGGFGPGFNGPLFLAVDLPGSDGQDPAVLERLSAALDADPGVALATAPVRKQAGDVAMVQVFPTTAPQDEKTSDLVHRLRDGVLPSAVAGTGAEVLVGGAVAAVVDFSQLQADRLPLFIGAVLALSFLLLMAVFRSLLVPLKAVVMNLLSIGAAYGVVVATFQWGWGGDALGLGQPGPVEAWAPMMLFAIVFGLSMDYEVFLLSRIKEEYDRTGDNATAVADGLAATARVITAAAAIMLFVFGGFVLSADRALQLFGLGLAVAVLIDATLVRLVLVPATMELLGDRNWWLPRWLGRVLPRVRVGEADDSQPELAGVGAASGSH